jgi:hypothetical protein
MWGSEFLLSQKAVDLRKEAEASAEESKREAELARSELLACQGVSPSSTVAPGVSSEKGNNEMAPLVESESKIAGATSIADLTNDDKGAFCQGIMIV